MERTVYSRHPEVLPCTLQGMIDMAQTISILSSYHKAEERIQETLEKPKYVM